MVFVDELNKKIEKLSSMAFPYVITLKANNLIMIEGYKAVLLYNKKEISLSVLGGKLTISGTELKILSYQINEIILSGQIDKITTHSYKE